MQSNTASPTFPLAGIAIIAGTAIGAGMFSLPIISAGMGYPWAIACLLLTWFFMLHSGLLILEANLNFPAGSSFDTFVGGTLGPRWNSLNNLAVGFVLYILSYAFISAGGSIVSHSLDSVLSVDLSQRVSGLLFTAVVASIVCGSTSLVGRVSLVLIAGMLLSFVYTITQLSTGVQSALLLDSKPEYIAFTFMALPVYLTSFGFHSSIPSLVKYYGKQPKTIVRCIFYGSSICLTIYIIWQTITLGQISRDDFSIVMQQGGNIGPMVSALSDTTANETVLMALELFANFAVISSFLGAALGLFDYISDKFKLDDNVLGRLKTATIAFVPPALASLLFPNGFLYAIGYAGLAAAIMVAIVPAQAAKVGRLKFGNSLYRVWGGNALLNLMFCYGVLIIACHLLAMLGVLPVFG